MAELLLMAEDRTNVNPAKDLMCYKKGYPVVVMPDGHIWGKKECLPGFTILKVPNTPVEFYEKYIEMEWATDDNGILVPVSRRMWKIKWQDLPQVTQDRMFVDGDLIIKACASYTGPYDHTWAELRSFLENQKTGELELDDPPCI